MPTTILRNLKLLIFSQLVIACVLGGALAWWKSVGLGASFAFGAGLMGLQAGLLAWSAWRTLEKKPFAWTLVIIVIKYAVLLGSVVYFARWEGFNPLGAGLGVASFVLAALTVAFQKDNNLGSSSL